MANTTIRNLINKLESLKRNTNATLDFNSPNINFKEREILDIVKDSSINLISLKTVATYFQNIYLAKFTKEELLILLSFDYSQLENTNVVLKSRDSFNIIDPPFDLGGKILSLNSKVSDIKTTHRRLLSVNKNKSLTFFINYLISQL